AACRSAWHARRPGVCAAVVARRRLCDRRGHPGEVPSHGGANPHRRDGPRGVHHLRMAVGTGPRRHATGGRIDHHGAAVAGSALVAQAHPGTVAAEPHHALPAHPRRGRRDRRRSGPRHPGVHGDAAPGRRFGVALLPRTGAAGWRRAQRGQRDPGGFPRIGYARRDHGARDRGVGGVRAAVAVPAGGREHRPAAAAWRCRAGAKQTCAGRSIGDPGTADPDGGAADRAVRAAPFPARPRPAGWRIRRRHHRDDDADRVVHGRRRALGGGAAEGRAGALDRRGLAAGDRHRPRRSRAGQAIPHFASRTLDRAGARRGSVQQRAAVRPRRVRRRVGRQRADAGGIGASVVATRDPRVRCAPRRGGGVLMEAILAIAIGALAGSGVWLLLRPRTFQVIIGLTLISYAANLFIFSVGGLRIGADPVLGAATDPSRYADPLPQALVLTAIVIGFATTALFLVVLLTSRGLAGNDHVDGEDGTP